MLILPVAPPRGEPRFAVRSQWSQEMSHHAAWFSLLSPSSMPRKSNITLSNLNHAVVFNAWLKPSLSKGRNCVRCVTSTSHQASGRCCCSTSPTLSPGPGFCPENHPRSFSHPRIPAMRPPSSSLLDIHADPNLPRQRRGPRSIIPLRRGSRETIQLLSSQLRWPRRQNRPQPARLTQCLERTAAD